LSAVYAQFSHYDTIYQERYMGLPQDNAKGYHDGSPINFAQNLTGHLLIVHGSGDDHGPSPFAKHNHQLN
jgi:dipeptidyl-peptidase-4